MAWWHYAAGAVILTGGVVALRRATARPLFPTTTTATTPATTPAIPPKSVDAPTGKRKVLVIGDSITVGYLPKFKKIMEAAGHTVIGEGLGGKMVAAIHQNAKAKYFSEKPTDVVILAGVNNLASKYSAQKIGALLTKLWLDAHEAGARVISIKVLPWACYSKYTENEKLVEWAKLNTFIDQAKAVKGGPDVVLDFTKDLGDDKSCLREELTRDRLHPNPKGAQLLASLVAKQAFGVG